MNILLIDDNQKITEMLSSYLKLKGHEVSISNDGRNGLSLLESCKFDGVVLDIAMPEFSGFDVMNNLHEDCKTNKKIVVLTAVPLSSTESDMLLEKGVAAILKKPANLQILLKTLTGQ